jgi:acyl-CoA thioester hydrolase
MAAAPQTFSQIFSVPVRVYYQDTDAGGVIYHAAYLDFLERSRTEWLRSLGFDHRMLTQEFNVVFMVHAIQLQYLKPGFIDDRLSAELKLAQLGASRIVLRQQVLRGEALLLDANVKLACVSTGTLKPVRMPDPIRNRIHSC